MHVYWGPSDASQLGKVLEKCANTEVAVFPRIDRDPALKPNPIPLVHIKRQHRFDYENGQCRRSELSENTEKKLFSFVLRPGIAVDSDTEEI